MSFIAPKLTGKFFEPLVLKLGVGGRGFAGWHGCETVRLEERPGGE
jgi:hypothetical protein